MSPLKLAKGVRMEKRFDKLRTKIVSSLSDCKKHTLCHQNVPSSLNATERNIIEKTDDRILAKDEKMIVTELALDDWVA